MLVYAFVLILGLCPGAVPCMGLRPIAPIGLAFVFFLFMLFIYVVYQKRKDAEQMHNK